MTEESTSTSPEIPEISKLDNNQLPSNFDVLGHLFYFIKNQKLSKDHSFIFTIENVIKLWDEVGITVKAKSLCVKKSKKLYEDFRAHQRNLSRTTAIAIDSCQRFKVELQQLFDIAPVNVANDLNEVRRNFLIQQRERRGSIQEFKQYLQGTFFLNLFIYFFNKLFLYFWFQENILINNLIILDYENTVVALESSPVFSDSPSLNANTQGKYSEDSYHPPSQQSTSSLSPPCKKSRGTIDIFTPKLVFALDKAKVSSRDAVHIVIAVLEAAGLDAENYIVNKTSIHEKRKKVRTENFEIVKREFKSQNLSNVVVHWDGKLLPDIKEKKTVDRLPVILSSNGSTKLLKVSKLDNSTGSAQSDAIFDALQEWGLTDVVTGFCCDTTPSNTGCLNGAATLLQLLLKRDILLLACRHHILELVLRSSFESLIPGTNGPNVPIFVRFRNEWPNIDKTTYESGLLDPVINEALKDEIESIKKNIRKHLTLNLERDDYKELLCLSLLFLGEKPKEKYSVRAPGAVHHARWMRKSIYTLLIFLFRRSFYLSKGQLIAFQQISIFIVKVYIKHWFVAESAEKAPNNDLKLVKDCFEFKTINVKISQATLKKILRHLWYLTPETAAMSIFDDEVPLDVKKKMVARFFEESEKEAEDDEEDESEHEDEHEEEDEEEGEDDNKVIKKPKVLISDVPNFIEKSLDSFVSPKSMRFFERFNLPTEWMQKDPESWKTNEEYLQSQKIVQSIKVVNDVAERTIHLFEEYNEILTKDEDQLQYVMHCLEEYRRRYPTGTKSGLLKRW